MTLDNKLGLMDSLELAKMEEKISKTRAKELFEKQLAPMRLWPLFMASYLKKSMTSPTRLGQSISPKGMFASSRLSWGKSRTGLTWTRKITS